MTKTSPPSIPSGRFGPQDHLGESRVNQKDKPPGLLISGTDTGVGKTKVTSWLAAELVRRGINLGLSKPVASGAEWVDGLPTWGDTESLRRVCPMNPSVDEITPIRFLEPLAPNVAARRDPAWQQRTLMLTDYLSAIACWNGRCEALLVEGVGGLLCPITDQATMADLAVAWGQPVLLVVRQGLGTINHTMMTLEIARARGIEIIGMVMNRSEEGPLSPADQTNREELARWVDVPIWGPIDFQSAFDPIPAVITTMADALLERWRASASS
jgi:dethiobiotin synthetase